jgi:hypothetical protein
MMPLDVNSLLSSPTELAIRTFDGCLKQQLTEFIQYQNPTHIVTAKLFGESSKEVLSYALNDWAIRINRCYLGRSWHSRSLQAKALKAFMVSVQDIPNGQFHAVLLVKPPETADPHDFVARAPSFFALESPVTFPPFGNMELELIDDENTILNNQIPLSTQGLVEKFILKLRSV